MEGEKFFELALRLSASVQAEDLRSATSRAYYGAYHKARDLLLSFGIGLPVSSECHAKITQILDNSGNSDVVVASKRLSSLRTERNAADYDLSKAGPETKSLAVLNLHSANQTMTCLDRCSPGGDLAAIREAVRQYAQDILRLPVT